MKVLIKYEDAQHIVTFDLEQLAELVELTPEQVAAAKNAAVQEISKS